jgi:hypothetical protein
MTVNALGQLLITVLPELVRRRLQSNKDRPDRKRALGGGRKPKLTPAQEVLLVLIYLPHNVAHEVTGQMFGVSADTSENLFHEIVPLLCESFPSNRFEAEKKFRGYKPTLQAEKSDRILINSFESPIPRPSDKDRQKRVYSGKKKSHTLKSQIVSDVKGEVLDIDAGHRGPAADKKIYEASNVREQFPNASKQGDPGYQGTEGIEVSHKKPRGGELTQQQKEENRKMASVRVALEHGIRRVKGFRVVREKYRLAMGLFPMVASAVVGLVHPKGIFV